MFTAASCPQICLEFRLFTQQCSQQCLVLRYIFSLDSSHSNVHSSFLSAGRAFSVPRPVQLSPKKDAPVRNPPQTKPAETINKDDCPQGRPLPALVPHPPTFPPSHPPTLPPSHPHTLTPSHPPINSSISPSSSFMFWKSLVIAFPQCNCVTFVSRLVMCLY